MININNLYISQPNQIQQIINLCSEGKYQTNAQIQKTNPKQVNQ